MRTLVAVLALGLAGCVTMPIPAFQVVELRDMNQKARQTRTVFAAGERPVLIVAGALAAGKEMFIALSKDGRPLDVSPSQQGDASGAWFAMGQLTPGSYRAQLFVAKQPAAAVDFVVVP